MVPQNLRLGTLYPSKPWIRFLYTASLPAASSSNVYFTAPHLISPIGFKIRPFSVFLSTWCTLRWSEGPVSLSSFSRWHALLLLLYWSGTVACNLVGVRTVVQAGNQAGALALLHLVPLLCSDRASIRCRPNGNFTLFICENVLVLWLDGTRPKPCIYRRILQPYYIQL